jgi:hypothetical protein
MGICCRFPRVRFIMWLSGWNEHGRQKIPENFVWRAALAAHQIEGAGNEDGQAAGQGIG